MSETKAASERSVLGDQASGRGRRRISTELLLLGAVSIWAFNFTAVKYGLTHGFSPLSYGSLRFGLAGVLFAGVTFQRERTLAIKRRDLRLLVAAALLGITLNQLAFVYALRLANASTVALLFGTGPVLVALVAHFSGTEHLQLRSWLGAAISFGGVTLVVLGSAGAGLSGGFAGILLGLCTAATWAVYAVAVGPLMGRYSPYRLNAMITLVGAAPLLVAATPQLAAEPWSQIPMLGWLSFLYSSVLAYLVTNMIWFRAIHRVGAAHAALYANLEPFLGALFAVFVLSEHLGPLQIAGGLVIGLGILIARKRGSFAPLAE